MKKSFKLLLGQSAGLTHFRSVHLYYYIVSVMRKWFDFSKKEIVRIADLGNSSTFIIRINGVFFCELFPPYHRIIDPI